MQSILQLSQQAGDLFRLASSRSGLDPYSPVMVALASGLDIALTLMEESTGVRYKGLTPESARKVVDYFCQEAKRSKPLDPQIALFYAAWAEALGSEYQL